MNFTGISGFVMRLPELIGIIMIIKWSIQGTVNVMRIRARGESILSASWNWVRTKLGYNNVREVA